MRRKPAGLFILLFVVATVVPAAPTPVGAAAAHGHRLHVDGTFHGTGAFVVQCTGVTQTGSGTFHDPVVGRGGYDFHMCVRLFDHPITFLGAYTLSTPGAVLNGTISGTYDPHVGLILPVTITGGTGRFARARGTITVGPIREHDFTNCDPTGTSCVNWKDSGPITGTITRVG